MKINDYASTEDFERLGEQQYNSLINYLKLVGIGCNIEYSDIKHTTYDILIVDCSTYGTPTLLRSRSATDPDAETQFSYEELLKLASLGDFDHGSR